MRAMSVPPTRVVGRYVLGGPIAVGGMASVHYGRLEGPVGFRRTVALKRMLGAFAGSPQARAMFIDEARLAARIHHGNVVQTLDVVEEGDELFLVLEYVHGETLEQLLTRSRELGKRAPVKVVTAVLVGALRGLHAAHDARGEDGQPLELVHRDLSPHNLIVDVNGVTRVLDFGVARARGRLQSTTDGQLKGKLAYLSPEQVHGEASRRSDLFAAGVVLWEGLSGKALFEGANEAALLSQVLKCRVPPLASGGVESPALQAVLDRALQREPEERFATASEMADALEACGAASPSEVAAWVKELAGETLAARQVLVETIGSVVVDAPVKVEPPKSLAPKEGSRVGIWVGLALALAAAGAWWVTRPGPVVTLEIPDSGVLVTTTVPPPTAPIPSPSLEVDSGVIVIAPRPTPTPPRKKRSKKPDCNPPYVIDADGVKRYKVECLD
jgi:serine/threonine-protein kinase